MSGFAYAFARSVALQSLCLSMMHMSSTEETPGSLLRGEGRLLSCRSLSRYFELFSGFLSLHYSLCSMSHFSKASEVSSLHIHSLAISISLVLLPSADSSNLLVACTWYYQLPLRFGDD